MKKLAVFPMCVGCVMAGFSSHAIDLKQSKLTQVVNDVEIISAAEQKQKHATVNDVFAMPDILRTGDKSRAELIAQDQTVTRVGANTVFSFDPANRAIDLKQGSLLFHSPHGKGGGSIHTGSATASVLGTTLIVVTTPNGGMKVIALEGEVEVKFKNGLKQKLDPGQMTFVLPGANQLAPVIIFRLDELTQNSLLVKGFSQPLQSIPLIENQIDHQNKLIAAGKISDTDLYVGKDATASQVEVLDLNTIISSQHGQQHQPLPPVPTPQPPTPPEDLAAAEAADAAINQSSLLDATIPTPPNHLFSAFFPLENNGYFNGQEFSGFVARNIFINNQDGSTAGISIDLSQYAGSKGFDVVSLNKFLFGGSAAFVGLSGTDLLSLIAGDHFEFTPGISIAAAVKNFTFDSAATLSLDNVSIYNSHKDLTLNSGQDVVLRNNALVSASDRLMINARANILATDARMVGSSATLSSFDGSVSLDNSDLNTSGHALVFAPGYISLNNSRISSEYVTLNGLGGGAIQLNNSTINAQISLVAVVDGDINISGSSSVPNVAVPRSVSSESKLISDPTKGAIALTSVSGSINITDTSISAHYLTLSSGDGILLDAYGHTVQASGPGATASFTAPNLVALNNVDLTSFGNVNVAANTINLLNVAFSGVVHLNSLLGIWNNGYVMPGAVNDLGGVTYNGQLVNAANGSSGQLAGTGIYIGTTQPNR